MPRAGPIEVFAVSTQPIAVDGIVVSGDEGDDVRSIGDGLRARTLGGQAAEVLLACRVLNQMTDLGDVFGCRRLCALARGHRVEPERHQRGEHSLKPRLPDPLI